jgi:hypothetical protein
MIWLSRLASLRGKKRNRSRKASSLSDAPRLVLEQVLDAMLLRCKEPAPVRVGVGISVDLKVNAIERTISNVNESEWTPERSQTSASVSIDLAVASTGDSCFMRRVFAQPARTLTPSRVSSPPHREARPASWGSRTRSRA